MQQTGCTDASCAVKIGQLLNMQFMILGNVAKLGSRYILTIDIVDVEKGSIIVSQKENVDGFDKIVDITPKMTTTAIQRMKEVLQGSLRMEWSPLKTTLFISGLTTLAAAGTLNVLGVLQSSWANDYFNTVYMTETGTPAAISTKYSNYQGQITASTIEYIIGWSLYGITAGLAVWWFLTPDIPVRSKAGKTALVPSVSPVFSFADGSPKLDGAAVSFSMSW
ncbi:MAG: hypothetical protein AABZ39_08990 [Spirochaetota bacterium]